MITRLNNHRHTIRKGRIDLLVPKHFQDCGHSKWDLSFMIVDHIPPLKRGGDRLLLLKKRELRWIHQLGSLKPGGLNIELKISSKMV